MTENTEPTMPIRESVAPVSQTLEADTRPVRAGTVIWGVILVAVAAMYFAVAQADLDQVSGWVILAWGVLALGAVLVVGGIIAALSKRHSAS